MSIIYDALKKVEASRTQAPEAKIDRPAKFRFKPYLIYLSVGCFGLLMANILYGIFTKPLPQYTKDTPPALVEGSSAIEKSPDVYGYQEPHPAIASISSKVAEKEPSAPAALVLNGVFFSEEEAYALINNRIVRKGDIIDGATVMQINLEGVELQAEGTTFKLSCAQ